jgi:hypothetical protein
MKNNFARAVLVRKSRKQIPALFHIKFGTKSKQYMIQNVVILNN